MFEQKPLISMFIGSVICMILPGRFTDKLGRQRDIWTVNKMRLWYPYSYTSVKQFVLSEL